ncbi:hypothetical protein [Methanococcus maripaludis]|uniref:Uncharacterized protein n=2 Tax=Methanococcus maripaludis TaxID=39152 RepID=A0A7J9PMG3_METMI|nr:hypothetical protein [Methanococcus maripaludis]MBA2862689.1 hypothetical protein [Methanococcus maripaludis]
MRVQILFLSLLFSLIVTTHAWDDCPFGVTDSDCKFPGACGRYIDTNNNNICDHSEPVPENSETLSSSENANYDDLVEIYVSLSGKELKTYTIKEVCEYYGIKTESLKNKLNINVDDEVTIDQVRSIYGLSVLEVKYAIFDCMVDEGVVNITENTISEENKSFSEKIIDFLFTWIDLSSFW